jgi:hypothetical protein
MAAADAAAGRILLDLGSAATTDATAYEAAGAVASHAAAYAHDRLPTADESAAISGANAPGAGNVFATMADVGAAGGGTVTSVGITGSDGLQVDSGSPVTTSGTINLGIDAATLRTHLGLGSAAFTLTTNYATAAQGALADSAVQAGDSVALATVDYTVGRFAVTAASVGASHTVALNDGEFQPLTLTGNTDFVLPDPGGNKGYSITLKLIQDATGSRAPTFAQADATSARWLGGSAPTWQTAPGAFDVIVLTHDGTDLIAAHVGGTS